MASASTNKKVGVKGKTYGSQARAIIANVLEFMKEEAKEGSFLLAKMYTDEFEKEAEDVASDVIPGFSTPGKSRKRKCPKRTLCESEMESIPAVIHNYYIIERKQPTLKGSVFAVENHSR
ncbi:hypothetical protein BDFB_012430 [Asbolus verrucosus]|uniref:Uncharacterized protein n=1 Tax=Asbolus verrucosus TaxID=1661398 RepID=A0A482V060_ASBVE|nr:hypothetical protein BDFB_012430 [Asbolus verrucosus]